MSSRTVGRGICPRCGREGAVVLKTISGRIYVYVRHGREWCYIGPLDRVDLATILYDLRDYQSFTSKFLTYVATAMGLKSVGTGVRALVFIAISLLVMGYALSLGGSSYGAAVLGITSIAVLLLLYAIASYEHRHIAAVRRRASMRTLIMSAIIVAATLIATLPLRSPITIKLVAYYIPYSTLSMDFPLTSALVTALVATYLSRRVETKQIPFAVTTIVLSCLIVSIPALLYVTMKVANLGVQYLLRALIAVVAPTLGMAIIVSAISIALNFVIAAFRKLQRL